MKNTIFLKLASLANLIGGFTFLFYPEVIGDIIIRILGVFFILSSFGYMLQVKMLGNRDDN
jgi:uncharacterized membrane protein|tara:strand:- start:1533 stop:1715 length:183 start_codon:yes stop_codon:yes gene_type:complete